jgi:ferritin-like metal-binding protein YciE
MVKNAFYELFLAILRDAFDAENQIVAALPNAVRAVSNNNLKEALMDHLDETKTQIDRLKNIFKSLNENPTGKHCAAMYGLLEECKEIITGDAPPVVKDAGLIVALQKIEHYEISSYGSARAIARHLNHTKANQKIDFDEIADILQKSLDEESEADARLTVIAEGGFFSEGINDAAEKSGASVEKR